MTSVLLCATDSGGARNIAALDEAVSRCGTVPTLVTSTQCLHLFESTDWCHQVVLDPSHASVARLFGAVQPSAVICGTTRYASPDRELVNLARGYGVRSVSVVDERFAYRLRFANEQGELVNLPDAIALMDEEALREAVSEGLPHDRCYATGSPALWRLAQLAEAFARNPPPRPRWLSDLPERPIVTFLSETLSADYGSLAREVGPLGPFVGYTEISVRESVVHAVKAVDTPLILVVKLHPAATASDVEETSADGAFCCVSVRDVDLWPLLWHSALVIGMRSMALLEAHLLGIPAVSYQPGLLGPERCTAVRLGLIPALSNEATLISWCGDRLRVRPTAPPRSVPRQHAFGPADSAERILALAINSH